MTNSDGPLDNPANTVDPITLDDSTLRGRIYYLQGMGGTVGTSVATALAAAKAELALRVSAAATALTTRRGY